MNKYKPGKSENSILRNQENAMSNRDRKKMKLNMRKKLEEIEEKLRIYENTVKDLGKEFSSFLK